MLFLLAALVSVLAVVLCSLSLRRRQRGRAAVAAAPQSHHVLVVGGSFAGLSCCARLLSAVGADSAQSVRVTLVEPRDYFEYTPGILRALVRPAHYGQLVTPSSGLGLATDPRFTHRRAVVTDIDVQRRRVRLAAGASSPAAAERGGEEKEEQEELWLPYDFAVLATGSSYAQDIKPRSLLVPAAADGESWLERHSLPHRRRELAALNARLRDSRHVVIVGAGLVGVVR